MQAKCKACDTVFIGSQNTFRYHVFTDKPSRKIKIKLAAALKDRIYEDSVARKAETDTGKLPLYRIYGTWVFC